jgi:hypothetical protein
VGEILVKVNGVGSTPTEIARRKNTIVDLAKTHAALSSNITDFSFRSITVHIWFPDHTKAQAFVDACEQHQPDIRTGQPKAWN